MSVGINSVREILVRVPAILREPDMGDFIEGTALRLIPYLTSRPSLQYTCCIIYHYMPLSKNVHLQHALCALCCTDEDSAIRFKMINLSPFTLPP